MSKHIHDGRSHCPACALEKIGRQKQRMDDLEAENARLQAEQTHILEMSRGVLDQRDAAQLELVAARRQGGNARRAIRRGRKERDGYKALAELRGEAAIFKEHNLSCGCKAVQGAIVFTEICQKHLSQGAKPGRLMGDDYTRDAIAATPEEEREKERR